MGIHNLNNFKSKYKSTKNKTKMNEREKAGGNWQYKC